MNQTLPPGDAILVQFQAMSFPYGGSFCTFSFNSKMTPPVSNPEMGIDYFYLSFGETVELSKGSGIFPTQYTVIYLGQGRVSVCRTGQWFLGASRVEIITINES